MILGASVLILVVSYLLMPDLATLRERIGFMLRVSARSAFGFLLLAYLATPLVVLLGRRSGVVSAVAYWIASHRRYLGLSMAFTHTVHFGFVVAVLTQTAESRHSIDLALGGFAMVVMWVMALTSNDGLMRRLGKWWPRIHKFGIHFLWLAFMQSFVARVGGPQDQNQWYTAISVLGFTALLIRITAFWKRRMS